MSVQITPELLDELDSVATNATPGPWRLVERGLRRIERHDEEFVCEAAALDPKDARYVAAANPATMLALTAHIRSLTDRLEKAEKDAVRLDWVIDNKATVQRIPLRGRPAFSVHRIEAGKFQRTEHASPREAIDAAIAQEGQNDE